MFDFLSVMLVGATIALAILAVEIKDVLIAVYCLCGLFVLTGVFFWMLNAPYLAVFQLLIYAGAIIALFIVVIMLTVKKTCRRRS